MKNFHLFDLTKDDDVSFNNMALDVFRFQFENNCIYRLFCEGMNVDKTKVNSLENIPFLPIEFFKTHTVVSNYSNIFQIFTSSGTTGMITSKHFVSDLRLYEQSLEKAFRLFYGDPKDFVFLALLPSYLEREGSSLVYMVDTLMKISNSQFNGYYLYNHSELVQKLEYLKNENKKVILIGVSFALLDLANHYSLQLPNTIIIETGGMKGRGKELIRNELHHIIKERLSPLRVDSEYGMTELLSQAYLQKNDSFATPPWMRILIRDIHDPSSYLGFNKNGGINVIDLANVNSCSFIQTQDMGKLYENQTFEVIGRFDNSDIRGCNLLVEI